MRVQSMTMAVFAMVSIGSNAGAASICKDLFRGERSASPRIAQQAASASAHADIVSFDRLNDLAARRLVIERSRLRDAVERYRQAIGDRALPLERVNELWAILQPGAATRGERRFDRAEAAIEEQVRPLLEALFPQRPNPQNDKTIRDYNFEIELQLMSLTRYGSEVFSARSRTELVAELELAAYRIARESYLQRYESHSAERRSLEETFHPLLRQLNRFNALDRAGGQLRDMAVQYPNGLDVRRLRQQAAEAHQAFENGRGDFNPDGQRLLNLLTTGQPLTVEHLRAFYASLPEGSWARREIFGVTARPYEPSRVDTRLRITLHEIQEIQAEGRESVIVWISGPEYWSDAQRARLNESVRLTRVVEILDLLVPTR